MGFGCLRLYAEEILIVCPACACNGDGGWVPTVLPGPQINQSNVFHSQFLRGTQQQPEHK